MSATKPAIVFDGPPRCECLACELFRETRRLLAQSVAEEVDRQIMKDYKP